MEKLRIDDVDRRVDSATVLRPLTAALGASDVALNYYELAPGDSFAYGFHMHAEQEELFVIQAGRATFDTESGTVDVEAGEIVRFGPGEYQQGRNEGDERVVALAIGAPRNRESPRFSAGVTIVRNGRPRPSNRSTGNEQNAPAVSVAAITPVGLSSLRGDGSGGRCVASVHRTRPFAARGCTETGSEIRTTDPMPRGPWRGKHRSSTLRVEWLMGILDHRPPRGRDAHARDHDRRRGHVRRRDRPARGSTRTDNRRDRRAR